MLLGSIGSGGFFSRNEDGGGFSNFFNDGTCVSSQKGGKPATKWLWGCNGSNRRPFCYRFPPFLPRNTSFIAKSSYFALELVFRHNFFLLRNYPSSFFISLSPLGFATDIISITKSSIVATDFIFPSHFFSDRIFYFVANSKYWNIFSIANSLFSSSVKRN